MNRFPYRWTLKDSKFTKDKGKVFSCFACGGGSTMGYKLAGFDVVGCLDIDPKMIEVYVENHKPKFHFCEGIQTFKSRQDLPEELFDLDILDGSPPCSSFSMVGNREKDWGKEKVFREGQAEQILDTLFFDFIDLAERLQPKIVVAENVKGLLLGEAKEYVRKIYSDFDRAGYYVEHFLLDASKMGVPQKRERVFFVALRKDLAGKYLEQKDFFNISPKIEMEFNEEEITFKSFDSGKYGKEIKTEGILKYFKETIPGNSVGDVYKKLENKDKYFSYYKVNENRSLKTITAGQAGEMRAEAPFFIHDDDLILAGSFPTDYNFLKNRVKYLIGMSVPPVMVANIASNIREQWKEVFE
jgi:DNA (cytosine-5)-methyltransferase 1